MTLALFRQLHFSIAIYRILSHHRTSPIHTSLGVRVSQGIKSRQRQTSQLYSLSLDMHNTYAHYLELPVLRCCLQHTIKWYRVCSMLSISEMQTSGPIFHIHRAGEHTYIILMDTIEHISICISKYCVYAQ